MLITKFAWDYQFSIIHFFVINRRQAKPGGIEASIPLVD